MADPNNVLNSNMAEASEVFILKQQVENAKTMLSELKRQRDDARELAAAYEGVLHDIDSILISWSNRSPWDRFWFVGVAVNAVWDAVMNAL